MANNRALYGIAGAMAGAERATTNLLNLQVAVGKMKYQQEQDKIGQDIKKKQLEQLTFEMKNQMDMAGEYKKQENGYRNVVESEQQGYNQGVTDFGGSPADNTLGLNQQGASYNGIPGGNTNLSQSYIRRTAKGFEREQPTRLEVAKEQRAVKSQQLSIETGQRTAKTTQLGIASGLRKEFNANKAFKDFQTINRSVQGLEEAYKLSTSPDSKSRIASDQALGVMFQKMLDPDSVVRESEYARTETGIGIINRIKGFMPKMQKGGLGLENEDRKALVTMARKLLDEGAKTYNQHYERYENIAQQYEIDPGLIFGGLEKASVGEYDIPEPLDRGNVISQAKEAGATEYNEETGDWLDAQGQIVMNQKLD